MNKGTTALVLLSAIISFSTAQAATCTKTVTSATGVNGNWGPLHNTRNFHYQVIKGKRDRFMHKRGRRQVGTKCRTGSYKVDHWSNGKDACIVRKTVSTTPIRKKIKHTRATGVRGNWGPLHNTRNFHYQIIKGKRDRFMHKRGRRQVGTKCTSGSYKIDHWSNGKDACIVTSYSYKYSCPAGYTLN